MSTERTKRGPVSAGGAVPYPAPAGWGERSGLILGYRTAVYRDHNDALWCSYGCELLRVEEWRDQLRALCELHEPDLADLYERAISGWLDYCEAALEDERPGGES